MSKSAIAQPVLINGGSLSTESNGVKGGAQISTEQQLALSQSSSMAQSSQSVQRQESYHSTSISRTESSESSYEYRGRARLTLADCQLELKLSILTIKPRSSGVEFKVTTLNLDEHVGNLCGELVWGDRKFSQSCKNIRLEGTLLVANARVGDHDVEAKLDLNEHITYIITRRCFEPIIPDPAFTELMSSAGWMNVAVITRPDMRGFLTNPAFQASIKKVAQRAVEEVISEMQEEMSRAVEKAVAMVSARSEEYIQYEIQSLTKRATLINAAAYSGLGQLTVMSDEQRLAYNTFAPHINHGVGPIFAPKPAPANGHIAAPPVPEAARKPTPVTPAK